MFFWRGWGISVLLLLLFWLIVAVVAAKSGVPKSAGNADADTVLQWLLAIALVLDGPSVFLLDRYRKSHPRKVKDAANRTGWAGRARRSFQLHSLRRVDLYPVRPRRGGHHRHSAGVSVWKLKRCQRSATAPNAMVRGRKTFTEVPQC